MVRSSVRRFFAGALAVAGLGLASSAGAQTFQAGVGSQATGIRITWSRPGYIQGNPGSDQTLQPGIMGYIIYRTDLTGGGIPEVVGGTLGDIRVFFDASFVPHDVPNVFSGRQPGQDPGTLETLEDVPGLIPGHRYTYRVQAAYHSTQDWDLDGVPDDIDLLSPLSTSSSAATAIVPAVTLAPTYGESVDLASLTVNFQTTPGADSYQVVVSRDLRFRRGAVRSPLQFVVPPDRGGPVESSITFDASRAARGSKQLFVTVIAWSSIDRFRPKPLGGISYPIVAVNPVIPPPPP